MPAHPIAHVTRVYLRSGIVLAVAGSLDDVVAGIRDGREVRVSGQGEDDTPLEGKAIVEHAAVDAFIEVESGLPLTYGPAEA